MDDEKISRIHSWLGTGSINIFGRPFAGKDTHGRRLVELFDAVLLGGGDILRNSPVPDHVKEHMRAGRLIPTDDYIAIVLPYLSREEFQQKALVLSSVGRWHGEEDGVLRATEQARHPMRAAIYLDISEDAVRERWRTKQHIGNRGERHDDTEDILEVRLAEYREKTLPVIDYYQQAGLLISIDSTQSKDDVFRAIVDELHQLALRNNG